MIIHAGKPLAPGAPPRPAPAPAPLPADRGAGSPPGPVIPITPPEESIAARVAAERRRLLAEAGLDDGPAPVFLRPEELDFTRAQREHTTLLFGGLTWKHERLIQAAWEGLGYRCEPLPTPDVHAFQLGKEYGNNGQCNPTYFTVGNLVQFLQRKRDEEGLSVEQLERRYVFLTAGACGPCRFGMYEAEYRLALANAGFGGFRVVLFEQSGGLSQSDAAAGLEMNLDFFLGMLNAMLIGDLVNELAYQVRPFEIESGATDRALEDSIAHLQEVFRAKPRWRIEDSRLGRALGRATSAAAVAYAGTFLDQLRGDHYTRALEWVRERFDRVAVDRLRARPIVKITGEFWAQTTEGDGNFNMFRFLEREGAQVLVEPIATWIMYMIHQARQKNRDQRGLPGTAAASRGRGPGRLRRRWQLEKDFRLGMARLSLAERLFAREFGRLRRALGGTCHGLTDQVELQRLGHPYYNSRAGGGEGHLEVAKNIYYSNRDLCHLVLSVKPFGCMPSTQSDGAQAAVVNHYKDILYLPVETSGEGEVNAHSRVQMALGEAKVKAKQEFAAAIDASGYALDALRRFVEDHPELQRPLVPVPHHAGTVGVGAGFVMMLAARMRAAGVRPTGVRPAAAAAGPAPRAPAASEVS